MRLGSHPAWVTKILPNYNIYGGMEEVPGDAPRPRYTRGRAGYTGGAREADGGAGVTQEDHALRVAMVLPSQQKFDEIQ